MLRDESGRIQSAQRLSKPHPGPELRPRGLDAGPGTIADDGVSSAATFHTTRSPYVSLLRQSTERVFHTLLTRCKDLFTCESQAYLICHCKDLEHAAGIARLEAISRPACQIRSGNTFLLGFRGKRQPSPISNTRSYRSGSSRHNEQRYRAPFHIKAGHGFV